jgi:MraZ protein
MLSGGYNNTLDEKGRVTFPIRLKNGFSGDTLVITKGFEKCLYLYPPDAWKEIAEKLENPPKMNRDLRDLQRKFLGWATEAEIDKSGRLAIPMSLREYASLSRDVFIMGLGKRIEIWDASVYKEGESDGERLEAAACDAGLIF